MRPYLKDSGERETALAWTEKTLLITKDELPGVLSRSEIISVRYEQIAPIAMAIMEVQAVIKSLQKSSRGKNGQLPESKVLGTAINNAVDSPVSERIKGYRKLFIEGTYLDSHPEDCEGVQQLKATIIQYVRAIQDSLEVHKRVCRDVAFYEILKNQLYKSFAEEAGFPSSSASSDDHFPSFPSFALDASDRAKYYSSIKSQPSISINFHRSSADRSFFDQRVPYITSTIASEDYNLPPLRIGRSPSSGGQPLTVHSASTHTHTPRESTSTTRNTPSTPVQAGTTTSTSPPFRTSSRTGSARKKDHHRSLTSPLGTSGLSHGKNGSVSSLSVRAKNMMGIASRSSGNVLPKNGVDEEAPPAPVKEKGLKRLGSLMRKNK